MNMTTNDVGGRRASIQERIRIRQETRIEPDDIKRMVVDHYAGRGVDVKPSNVSIEASGSSGSGFSGSGPSFRGAVIRFFGEEARKAERDGLPTTLTLSPEAVASIVARRLAETMHRMIDSQRIEWEVSDGSYGHGGGGPHLRHALIRTTIDV